MSTDELIALEKKTKIEYEQFNNLQLAEKILLNSLYGAQGASGFRYFDVNLAASITANGQLAIRWIERKLNELVCRELGEISGEIEPRNFRNQYYEGKLKDRVVLIDTDSVVLNLEDLVNVRCPKDWTREQKLDWLDEYGHDVIEPLIEKSYVELSQYINAFDQKLRMKRENIVDKMINVARKNYFMSVYDSEGVHYGLERPKHKIMGIRVVKSDVSKVVRERGKEFLPILIHGTEEEFQKKIKEFKDEYMKLPIAEIAFPKSVSNISSFRLINVKSKLKKVADECAKSFERYNKAPNGEEKKKLQERYTRIDRERRALENKIESGSKLYCKGTPIHVKAALHHNDLIDKCGLNQYRMKIGDGDKLKYVMLKKQNPYGMDVIGFQDTWPVEFGLDDYVDRELMFTKSFLSIIGDLGAVVGWSTEPKASLDFLFG